MAKKTFKSKYVDLVYEVIEEVWLDEDTYLLFFNDMVDGDGDTYHLEVEYHKDEERVTFVRAYEYDNMDATPYIPTNLQNEIEEYILKQVGVVKGMLSKQKITIELTLDIDPTMSIGELHEYLKSLSVGITAYGGNKATPLRVENLGWYKD